MKINFIKYVINYLQQVWEILQELKNVLSSFVTILGFVVECFVVECWIFGSLLTTQKTGIINCYYCFLFFFTLYQSYSTLRSWAHKIKQELEVCPPELENNHILKCCFCNFSTNIYMRVYEKMPNQHYNVMLS